MKLTSLSASNISFALPYRSLLNRSLVTLAIYQGLDAAILDPCDLALNATIIATEALLGKEVVQKLDLFNDPEFLL